MLYLSQLSIVETNIWDKLAYKEELASLVFQLLKRLRQNDHKFKLCLGLWSEFQTSLDNLVRPYFTIKGERKGEETTQRQSPVIVG